MYWLLITTPITTVFAIWLLHFGLGLTSLPLIIFASGAQLVLGVWFARLAGRHGRTGLYWSAAGVVITFAVVWLSFPDLS